MRPKRRRRGRARGVLCSGVLAAGLVFVEAAAVVARAALQKSCERCDRNSDASVRWLGKAGDAAARCDTASCLVSWFGTDLSLRPFQVSNRQGGITFLIHIAGCEKGARLVRLARRLDKAALKRGLYDAVVHLRRDEPSSTASRRRRSSTACHICARCRCWHRCWRCAAASP